MAAKVMKRGVVGVIVITNVLSSIIISFGLKLCLVVRNGGIVG